MWLRLALNTLLALLIFSACSSPDRQVVDKLNSLSYAYHYRHIDSTELFAQRAYDAAAGYAAGRAEALNNKAFVSIARMDYDKAEQQLNEALSVTDNQIELYIAEVQMMRLCQRRSDNRAFYEHRERAESHLLRIREERDALPERLQRRMNYAETEMAIVNSTYYYYVGLERQSVEAIQTMDTEVARRDTAQYLNYLYNIGAGGVLTDGSAEQIRADEIECLERCLTIADRCHYPYFKAQALEGLADHTGDISLAEEALQLFKTYGDVYQIAGAYRTLASCYHAMGDDYQALDNLNKALADKRINQAPDLVASIREQLSVAYSAVDDKPQSDYNRNIYIDLQEQTRQDRELEARAGILDREATQLNWMILAVIVAILLLLFFLWLFNRLNRRQQDDHQLDDVLEQKQEEVAEARLRVERNERRHLEQRAKISLAMGILPLIDRIRHEVNHLVSLDKLDNPGKQESLNYIRELTDNINEQNEVLTQWIQLRQGELSMHVESFPLQALFDIVARSKKTFQMKGVDLRVSPTEATVKADRVLTLFMLNTLADNARKFTPEGGHVDISATEKDNYVEVSVADTGHGMNADVLAHVFDHKVQQGHGFGLMNCKGIIEKYRKTSQLFSVCSLQAESEEGRGSRFFFRLPKGIKRLILLLAILSPLTAHLSPLSAQSALDRAHIFADSAYFSNINGTYARTLEFADSCRACLNAHYQQQHPKGQLLMQAESDDATPAEIEWLHDGIDTNYQIILDIRNESAVAALALHEWSLYAYNNKVYTQLFKELSADATLADYCRTMQQSQQNKRIAVILLLVLLVLIVPAYYMLYYRHRLYQRFRQERQQQTNIEMADDELRRAELENANLHVANSVLDNCLSTLKHETMYYPSRIRQLVDAGDMQSLTEVAAYYRDLYGILIQQATSQVERIKLHIHPVELYGQKVLGDENLLHYLFELIRGEKLEARGEKLEVKAEVKDDKYVVFSIPLTTRLSPLTSLLIRQIVRDHGEATARRGCGIVIDNNLVNITLPRHNGKI
jgi:signal transduction histidine kinase